MSKTWIALVCATLLSGPAEAADFAKVGPLASAESIMTARGQLREDGIEFAVEIRGSERAGTWTADLAPDFMIMSNASESTITDYALKRLITQDAIKHSFTNTSLYAIVDFFVAETYNRRILNQILSKANIKERSQDAFWTQSELHVVDSTDGVPAIVRSPRKDGAAFSYQGKEIASYALSAQPVTNDQRRWLARYLTMNTALHPSIIAEIASSGHMPSRISYIRSPMHNGDSVEMAFKPATSLQVAYSLRKDLKLEPLQTTLRPVIMQNTLELMATAAKGQAPGRRNETDFHAAIDTALRKGQVFQALVLMFEMNEQYGEGSLTCTKPCSSGTDVAAAAKSDARAVALVGALEPKSKAEMEAAIKTLTAMKRDDLSNAYVIDDFLANDLVEMGKSDEALPLFAAAVKGNSYLAGYYKDVGDVYRFNFHPDLAWFCYDVGRALPGGVDAPVISQMNNYETQLEAKNPQFF